MTKGKVEGPKIDFVVAGAQKGGTRSLSHFLTYHPEIGMSKFPEAHFFDRDDYFNADPDYDIYHSRFTPESLAKTTGDSTPSYLYWRPAIERIHAYNPGMKIIVLLRNPIERAYSHWNMDYTKGREKDRFVSALLKELVRRRLFASTGSIPMYIGASTALNSSGCLAFFPGTSA